MSTQPQVPPSGPPDAEIMIVGEAPGEQELYKLEPFVGASGAELTKMLHEAGIARSQCFITNVVRIRPPGNDVMALVAQAKKDRTAAHVDLHGLHVLPPVAEGYNRLHDEIERVRPKIIIALGNLALWAVSASREWGVTKWRGSLLDGPHGSIVIPTYHPAAVLRNWAWRAISVHDLKKAREALGGVTKPHYEFITRPHYDLVASTILDLIDRAETATLPLAVDIETRAGHIACLGFAWSSTNALCIPFMCIERDDGYWTPPEEVEIVVLLHRLLCHPNVQVIGQNWLYDTQYILRHLRFTPAFHADTMLMQHTAFPGLPKSLDFLASMYCAHYVYWKDDGKDWNVKLGEDQLWTYNCEDCVRTFEIYGVLEDTTRQLNLTAQVEFQHAMFWPVLQTMTRGCRIDHKNRGEFALDLTDAIAERETWLNEVFGHPVNVRSPAQMKKLFYDDLNLPVRINRKSGKPSLDDEALKSLARKEPLVEPILDKISEIRSLGVFLSTFVQMPLDVDKRMRTAYNIAGTETFRFSSRENAFNSGGNLQNLPKGDEAAGLPNVRSLFIPDPGNVFFDMDLDRADLQVVVWEADDADLKRRLRLGVDLHLANGIEIEGLHLPPEDELIASHPNFPEHLARFKKQRKFAKAFIHGTNYGGGARTMAINCGITVAQSEMFQRRWFAMHPGIMAWHRRTEASLKATHSVTNAFGYRRHYFDRIDSILPEALAWVPQSTVALYINLIWLRFFLNIPELQALLQVHDSLAGQFPYHLKDWVVARMKEEAAEAIIPYPDPLIIPVGVSISEKSWGDC